MDVIFRIVIFSKKSNIVFYVYVFANFNQNLVVEVWGYFLMSQPILGETRVVVNESIEVESLALQSIYDCFFGFIICAFSQSVPGGLNAV